MQNAKLFLTSLNNVKVKSLPVSLVELKEARSLSIWDEPKRIFRLANKFRVSLISRAIVFKVIFRMFVRRLVALRSLCRARILVIYRNFLKLKFRKSTTASLRL